MMGLVDVLRISGKSVGIGILAGMMACTPKVLQEGINIDVDEQGLTTIWSISEVLAPKLARYEPEAYEAHVAGHSLFYVPKDDLMLAVDTGGRVISYVQLRDEDAKSFEEYVAELRYLSAPVKDGQPVCEDYDCKYFKDKDARNAIYIFRNNGEIKVHIVRGKR